MHGGIVNEYDPEHLYSTSIRVRCKLDRWFNTMVGQDDEVKLVA
jgi:hypothetical protein